jgi:hypothetical protein
MLLGEAALQDQAGGAAKICVGVAKGRPWIGKSPPPMLQRKVA